MLRNWLKFNLYYYRAMLWYDIELNYPNCILLQNLLAHIVAGFIFQSFHELSSLMLILKIPSNVLRSIYLCLRWYLNLSLAIKVLSDRIYTILSLDVWLCSSIVPVRIRYWSNVYLYLLYFYNVCVCVYCTVHKDDVWKRNLNKSSLISQVCLNETLLVDHVPVIIMIYVSY